MDRRTFLQTAGMGAAALTLPLWLRAAPRQNGSKRPLNILFLMTDQHRGDAIGAAGNRVIHTPNLDRLAREGALFHSAYTSLPSCTPARASLLTGQSPWGHGMLGYYRVAKEYPFEFPVTLNEAGYYTAVIGKNHFYPQRQPHGYTKILLDESGREQSVDFRSDYRSWLWSVNPLIDPDATGIGWNSYRSKPYALPAEYHPTHWIGESAVRFLEQYDREEPFLLKVSFERPHSPYDPPRDYWDLYEGVELPAASVGEWAEEWYGEFTDPKPYNLARGNLGADQVQRSKQGYYGNISFIDYQIGRVLSALEKRGLLENTLILMTADHGDMQGDHHLWRKTYAYEGSAHIPMIVRWPEGMVAAKRGMHLSQPVELRDIAPTFLEVAGLPVPDSVEGASLLQLIRGETAGWREYIDMEHATTYFPENAWTALTDGKTKYIYHAYTGQEQLFDLEADPGEISDLSGVRRHARELKQWRDRMIRHLSVRGEPWVVDGKLGIRKEKILLGPNYPGEKT